MYWCTLGEPDEVLEGGAVLIYRWTEVRGFLLLAASGGQAVAIPFPGHRAVRLAFGLDGLLLHLDFEEGKPSQEPETDQPPGGANPGG